MTATCALSIGLPASLTTTPSRVIVVWAQRRVVPASARTRMERRRPRRRDMSTSSRQGKETAVTRRHVWRLTPASIRQSTRAVKIRALVASFATALSIGACGSPAPLRQAGGLPYDSASTEQLASGVIHRRLVANQGPFTINVVEVDMRRRDLVIAAMHAFDSLRGREATSAMVARRNSTTRIVA